MGFPLDPGVSPKGGWSRSAGPRGHPFAPSFGSADAPEEIQKRLGIARKEIAQWNRFDYLLISTTIAEDLRRMLAIVEVEKMRAGRARPPEF